MTNKSGTIENPRVLNNGYIASGGRSNGRILKLDVTLPTTIVKRDGRIVPFDAKRIETAIIKCFNDLVLGPNVSPTSITAQVVNVVAARYDQPSVEDVQDIVEEMLQAAAGV